MNCKLCGQPLPEGTAFCSVCGAKQDVAVQSSTQPNMPPQAQPQMYYEVKVKQKKNKNPIVPVILNLIAAALVFSLNLYSVFTDQPKYFSDIAFYIILIPLLLSLVVLCIKNRTGKLIISIAELIFAISMVVAVFKLIIELQYLWIVILPVIASVYSIFYARDLDKHSQASLNKKTIKVLSAVYAVIAVAAITLSITTIFPYAQYQTVVDEMNTLYEDGGDCVFLKQIKDVYFVESERSRLYKAGGENELLEKVNSFRKRCPKYVDEINEMVREFAIKELEDYKYSGAAAWLKTLENTKQVNELAVWVGFREIMDEMFTLTENAIVSRLKNPLSFESYGRTFHYEITKSGNENEVIVGGSVEIDYSATNSFGARLTDTYWFECPKRTLDTLGLSKEEVEDIVTLDHDQILDRCLQQNT